MRTATAARTLAALLLVTAASLPVSATAQPAGTAEVILARQPAEVVPRGQTGARAIAAGDRLSEGDRVRTGRGGAAEIRFGDGSLVRLAELSDLEIERLDVDAAGAPSTSRFNLAAGQARAWVARQLIAKVAAAQGRFAVQTTTAVAAVRQTDFAVVHDANAATSVYTFEGATETTSRAGGSVTCARNRWTRVEPGRAPGPCEVIPLRSKRAVLKLLAFQAVTAGPQDPDREALGELRSKLASEKMTGLRAGGAAGLPARTDPVISTQGAVDVIVDID